MAGLHARSGDYERAAELVGAVSGQPACSSEDTREIDRLLPVLRAKMPERRLAAALERGRDLDIRKVAAEMIKGCPT